MNNETRITNGMIVKANRIIGTRTVVYSAWEPSAPMGNHGSITTIKGKWYGQVGTLRVPDHIKALEPGSPERLEECKRHYVHQVTRAQQAIVAAFPEIMGKARPDGSMRFQLVQDL